MRRLVAIALLAVLVVAIAPASAPSAAAQQEEGPYDGCYYVRSGNTYARARCPQPDGSTYYFQPDARGIWLRMIECSTTPAFTACLFLANDLYVETFPDGSTYTENADRTYAIFHVDGSVAEAGYYDSSGQQRPTTPFPTNRHPQAMVRHSQMYWAVYQITVGSIIRSNPTAFDWLLPGIQGANDYASCLHLNDSATDFDRDGRTGFNELSEYCAS